MLFRGCRSLPSKVGNQRIIVVEGGAKKGVWLSTTFGIARPKVGLEKSYQSHHIYVPLTGPEVILVVRSKAAKIESEVC